MHQKNRFANTEQQSYQFWFLYKPRTIILTNRRSVDLVPIFDFHSFILQVKETFTENFEERTPDEDHQEDYQDEFTKKLCRKLMEFV